MLSLRNAMPDSGDKDYSAINAKSRKEDASSFFFFDGYSKITIPRRGDPMKL
jgi:hypothetical protein